MRLNPVKRRTMKSMNIKRRLELTGFFLCILATPAGADQVITDDLVVQGSACIGFDCANGEGFGDDTLRLRENNLRIYFNDESTAPGAPAQDWWLIGNDSANGGLNFIGISDFTGVRPDRDPNPGESYEQGIPFDLLDVARANLTEPEIQSNCTAVSDGSGNSTVSSEPLGPNNYNCPDTVTFYRNLPEEMDFLVDASSNGFHIAGETVDVGTKTTRRLVNVAPGVAAGDAVTIGQLDAAQATLTAVQALGNAPVPGLTPLEGRMDVVESDLTGLDGRVGVNAGNITQLNVSVDGLGLTGDGNVAGASATGTGSTALGAGSSAKTRDLAVGYESTVTADGSVAIGANNLVESQNSVALGADSHVAAQADGSVALGQNARVAQGAERSVAIGQDSEATEADTVSVGSGTLQRRISHVASAQSATDAVTLTQLQQSETRLQAQLPSLSARLSPLEDEIEKVGAMNTALSALIPNPKGKGNLQVSLGLGQYGDKKALAAGFFHYLRPNIVLNAGYSTVFSSGTDALQARISVGW